MGKYKVKTDQLANFNIGEQLRYIEEGDRYYSADRINLHGITQNVIDRNPDWFEKIQDEFEVGDWVFYKPTEYVGRLIKESEWNKSSWQCTIEGLRKEKSRYRHATDDEIKQALVKEAKRRGFKENRYYDARPIGWDQPKNHIAKNNFKYVPSRDILRMDGWEIYKQGDWAELVDQTPDITINGYDAEEKDGRLMFGCEIIDPADTDVLSRAIKKHDLSIIRAGQDITDQIKQIAEYYEETT